MGIILNFNRMKVIDKVSSKFGNGAHILVSKKDEGKKAKIIIGNSKIAGKKIELGLFDSEILERSIVSFGTGAHIIIPKEYSGREIKLIIGEK